ncbi:hypothetical protein T10_3622 [Trichinella papuae]|uniref:Uncharacterized protein n=1 Tax=Trichinella papuae TaxID=268474 RepID=A0A0V1MTG9_9BILA|nr:hypothetical protein T10_3622 [Trichinella papuae]
MLKSKFSEIQVMHHTNLGTTGTIRRNLQTTTIYHFLHTQIQLHMKRNKFSEILVMHHTNVGTTGTIRRNLQTPSIHHFLHPQMQLQMMRKEEDLEEYEKKKKILYKNRTGKLEE